MFIWINHLFLHNTIRDQHPERYVKASAFWADSLKFKLQSLLIYRSGKWVEAIHKSEARLLASNKSSQERGLLPKHILPSPFFWSFMIKIIQSFIMLPSSGYLIRFFQPVLLRNTFKHFSLLKIKLSLKDLITGVSNFIGIARKRQHTWNVQNTPLKDF